MHYQQGFFERSDNTKISAFTRNDKDIIDEIRTHDIHQYKKIIGLVKAKKEKSVLEKVKEKFKKKKLYNQTSAIVPIVSREPKVRGEGKEDRYSGLAICYKEQIGDGRSISIKKTNNGTDQKTIDLRFVQHVSVDISDHDGSEQIKFEIININKIGSFVESLPLKTERLAQMSYDKGKSIMMVGDVPKPIRNQEEGSYDLRNSFEILERTGEKDSNDKEIFIEPFTTKNIQLLEEKDLNDDSLVKQYHIFNSCPLRGRLVCSDTEIERKNNKAWTGTNGTAKPTNTFIYYTQSCANYAIITDFSLPTGKSNIFKFHKMSGGVSKTNSIFRVPYKYSSSLLYRHMLIRNKQRIIYKYKS